MRVRDVRVVIIVNLDVIQQLIAIRSLEHHLRRLLTKLDTSWRVLSTHVLILTCVIV